MKTASLELSKQLKEAGYPQESEFVWSGFKESYPISLGIKLNGHIAVRQVNDRDEEIGLNVLPNSEYEVIIAAPTAEEILDQLPHWIKGEYIEIWKEQWGAKIVYLVGYEGLCSFSNESLAEAAGEMWLYLKENNLLKPNTGKIVGNK